jgi:hypothetical protein
LCPFLLFCNFNIAEVIFFRKTKSRPVVILEHENMTTKNETAIEIEKKIKIPMIILALLIIPLVLIELEIVPTNTYVVYCATMIDDAIWFAFLFEYLILVSLYDDKVGYTKRNALNLIIIITPPLISPEGFTLIRSLRALRILRLFRALRVLRVVIALQN